MPKGNKRPLARWRAAETSGKANRKPDDIIFVHDQLDQAVVGNHEDILDGIVDIPLGEGVVLPVLDESMVVRHADALRPGNQFLFAFKMLDPQVAAFHCPFGDFFHPLRNLECIRRQVAGDKIDFLLETERLDQFWIVIVVVGHHGHHLAMFGTQNLDAVPVEGGKTLGTDHHVQTALARPIEGSIEESLGGAEVILAIEVIKLGFFCFDDTG